MSYLNQLKKSDMAYACYKEVKEIVRNTYKRLKIDYSQKNQLKFSRVDQNIKYTIYNARGHHKLQITNNDEMVFNGLLSKSNMQKIRKALDDTRPSSIDKSSVAFNAKLCNRYSSKRFDRNHILAMTSWKIHDENNSKHSIVMPDGYVYKGHSSAEIKIINHLMSKKCASIIRGQDYAIPYGDQHYYPDLVYLNHLDQVVVLEVKGKSDFSAEKNIIKYIALAEHCYKNGYVYGMVDKDFVTMKSFLNLKPHRGFEQAVLKVLKKDGVFNSQSLTKLRNESFSHLKRSHLMKLVTKFVIEHRYINRPKTAHDLNIMNKKLKIDHYYLIKSYCY
jgi:hypothetical protein